MGGLDHEEASKRKVANSSTIAKTNISTETPSVSIETPKGPPDSIDLEVFFNLIQEALSPQGDFLQDNLDHVDTNLVPENTERYWTWPISSTPQWGLGSPITAIQINEEESGADSGSEILSPESQYNFLEPLVSVQDSVSFYNEETTPSALIPFVQFPLLQRFEIEINVTQEGSSTLDISGRYETEIKKYKTDADDQFRSLAAGQMQETSKLQHGFRGKKIRNISPFPPEIVVNGISIPVELWAKAYMEEDFVKAGMTLFEKVFSVEEICRCTLSGRCDSKQLNENKRNAILKAIWWMRNKEHKNPYPIDTSILLFEDPPVAVKELIEQKVFVEKRSEIRRKSGADPVVKRRKIEKSF